MPIGSRPPASCSPGPGGSRHASHCLAHIAGRWIDRISCREPGRHRIRRRRRAGRGVLLGRQHQPRSGHHRSLCGRMELDHGEQRRSHPDRRARDTAGNLTTSSGVSVTTANPAFVNEVVVPGITDATTIAFLPGGRMLIGELSETILVVQPGANQPDPTPFLQLDGSRLNGEQGLLDILPDLNFAQNGYYYVFYTHGTTTSNHNRVSRFTASGNGTVPGSEVLLWEDPDAAGQRTPRWLARVRHRRQALHLGRGQHGCTRRATTRHPQGQDSPDQPGRNDPDRQSLPRRRRPQPGRDLGARAAQPVPNVDRPGHGQDVSRRRWLRQPQHRYRRTEPHCPRRQLWLARLRGAVRCFGNDKPDLLLPARRTRWVRHRRHRLSRKPIPERILRHLLLR